MKHELDRPELARHDRPVVKEGQVKTSRRDRLCESVNERCAAGGQPQAVLVDEMGNGDYFWFSRDHPPRLFERLESIDNHPGLAGTLHDRLNAGPRKRQVRCVPAQTESYASLADTAQGTR